MLLGKGVDIEATDEEGNVALADALAETTHGMKRLVPSLRNKDAPYKRHLVTVERRAVVAQLLLFRQHETNGACRFKGRRGCELFNSWWR